MWDYVRLMSLLTLLHVPLLLLVDELLSWSVLLLAVWAVLLPHQGPGLLNHLCLSSRVQSWAHHVRQRQQRALLRSNRRCNAHGNALQSAHGRLHVISV